MFRLLKNNRGSWGMVAVATISAGARMVGSGAFVGSPESPNRPEYFEDPDYRETQDYLKDFGMGMLEGDVPEYFKGIGEYGGEQFEDILGLTKRDIQTSTQESLAKSGRARGGQLAASTAEAIGDVSIEARYKDFTRAISGRRDILGLGLDVTEGVRGAGAREGEARNRFNIGDYDREIEERNFRYQDKLDKASRTGEAIGAFGDFAGDLGAIYDYKKGTNKFSRN